MLSILIPVYNYNITALVKALHSQCLQSGVVFEIIVADDASAPEFSITNKEILQLQHCRLIQHTANMGRTLTRKQLANEALYGTLLFLDADVLPADDNFINRYLPFIGKKNELVVGGYAYLPAPGNSKPLLRWHYGISREQKTATERNQHPYGSIFSGNFLTQKAVFLEHNYPYNHNFYGLDMYFSYSLYKSTVDIVHIDNPIYHLGLESDTVFFNKCLESVRVRKDLLADKEGIEDINSLLRHYKKLKKLNLDKAAALAFKITEPVLKKLILNNHNLFCLDLYRLGYLCTLK
ncbi:glycosyltransferase family 2 protein [Flavobacterium zepuense]|uniref:Glycosyltransferase family 2 protein n=1 Tax=Flavobacterium zepuense TaxID=2593302 RepID=A0A552UXL2_9FLAO|nr:glycosyltransferase family 2 protein [Flavobacterium zepuense]TRW22973.1 glycosyltransferase family 2 protein [Flavobacterium zepuense]